MQSTTSSTRTFMKPPPEKKDAKPPKRSPIRHIRLRLPWLLILLLIIFSIFMIFQYRAAKQKVDYTTSQNNNRQVNDVIGRVGRLIILPPNETPTVATVVHADKLKSQAFFSDAKDGDKVLVYAKAKRAYLYRPSINQLVTVSAVTVSPNGSTQIGN